MFFPSNNATAPAAGTTPPAPSQSAAQQAAAAQKAADQLQAKQEEEALHNFAKTTQAARDDENRKKQYEDKDKPIDPKKRVHTEVMPLRPETETEELEHKKKIDQKIEEGLARATGGYTDRDFGNEQREAAQIREEELARSVGGSDELIKVGGCCPGQLGRCLRGSMGGSKELIKVGGCSTSTPGIFNSIVLLKFYGIGNTTKSKE